MDSKRLAIFVLTLLAWSGTTQAETLAEMLRRMDRELQELRTQYNEINLKLDAVPKGAVVPFRLVECPTGWTPFTRAAGRTIIGVGEGEGLSERALGERGGKENHELTEEELPRLVFSSVDRVEPDTPPDADVIDSESAALTGFSGSGASHDNMPPWIALMYCEKQ